VRPPVCLDLVTQLKLTIACFRYNRFSFSSTVNEARFGYSFIRHDELPQESVEDSSIGMQRSTASQYPGLPLIVMGRDDGGATIGTSDITYRGNTHSISVADTFARQWGRHSLRLGGEIRHSEWRARAGVFSYEEIEFPTFNDFLIGNTGVSQFLPGNFRFRTSRHRTISSLLITAE
jgi:hypothetical protein